MWIAFITVVLRLFFPRHFPGIFSSFLFPDLSIASFIVVLSSFLWIAFTAYLIILSVYIQTKISIIIIQSQILGEDLYKKIII
jgi:hypothetical protein